MKIDKAMEGGEFTVYVEHDFDEWGNVTTREIRREPNETKEQFRGRIIGEIAPLAHEEQAQSSVRRVCSECTRRCSMKLWEGADV